MCPHLPNRPARASLHHTVMALLGAWLLLGLMGCAGDDTAKEPATADPETLRTPATGPVIGITDARGAHAWLGLPYAQPPTGALRWRAPRPMRAWDTARQATTLPPVCPQYGSPLGGTHPDTYGKLTGQEDCLYLNIWAPPLAADALPSGDARLPVMLWVHGGGNTIGYSGFYDGGHLATTHDVIVLTINYRLGPFGWFQHPAMNRDGDARERSGNFGTLDIIAALQWVQQHIDAFGGDPDRVTVFGESAGATNVASLLASPLARGLFQRAAMQSGNTRTADTAWASHYADDDEPGHPNSSAEVIARILQQQGPASSPAAARTLAGEMDPQQLAEYLRTVDTEAIFAAYRTGAALGIDLPAVIADGEVIPTAPLLEVLADPMRHDGVPVLLGTNRDEPKIFMAFDPDQMVRAFGLPLWARDADAYDLEAEYGARAWKARGVDAPAAALLQANTPAYAYRWDWDEEGRLLFVDLGQILGAAHGLEIPFVFGHFEVGPQTSLIYNQDNAAGREALSAAMMSYWAQFAHTGAPGRGRDGTLPLWQAYDTAPSAERVMLLDTPAGGGLRMSTLGETRTSVLESLRTDPRISDAGQRCAMFDAAFRWTMDPELVTARNALGCGHE